MAFDFLSIGACLFSPPVLYSNYLLACQPVFREKLFCTEENLR